MTLTRTAGPVLAALLLVATLAGCAAQSPEDAYLAAIKGDDRITQESTDKDWLELGKSWCELKETFDADEMDSLSEATAETVSEMRFVNAHATEHLCPDE